MCELKVHECTCIAGYINIQSQRYIPIISVAVVILYILHGVSVVDLSTTGCGAGDGVCMGS